MPTLSSWRCQYIRIKLLTISTLTRTLALNCCLCISSSAMAQSDTLFHCSDVLGPDALHFTYSPSSYDPDKYRYPLFAVVGPNTANTVTNLLSYTASDSMEGACNKLIRTTRTDTVCNPQSSATWITRSDTIEVVSATLITAINSNPATGEHYACQTNGRRTIEWCGGNTSVMPLESVQSMGGCSSIIPRAYVSSGTTSLVPGQNQALTISAYLVDKEGTASRLKNRPMTFSLSSSLSDADPGRLSTTSVTTDNQGFARLTYYPPPTWTRKQVITIKATCEDCVPGASWPNKGPWDTHRITLEGPDDIVIGFFNGVANTEDAAQDSLKRLEKEFGPQYKDSPLEYDWFYNQTACGDSALGKVSCLEDVAEVFEQRSRELNGVFANRWESFWDILAGRQQQDTSFTGRLISLLGEGGKALFLWVDGTASAILNQLASSFLKLLTLFIDSPTYENQASHLERLTSYADDGSRFLLVAHSQGNLFVNSSFDALKAARPETQAHVVHVAPASPTLRGDYVLSDIDLVINALRITGPNSVPNVNINLPLSKTDPSGHSFEPSYLDKARAAYARTIGMITTGLEALAQ